MKTVRDVVLGFMILLCILIAGQAFGDLSKGQVLLIVRPLGTGTGAGAAVDYAIIRELGVMKTILEDAGFVAVVATVDGQPVKGKAVIFMPDIKFSDVKIADYKGVLVPCMNAGVIPPESIQILKDALVQGRPIGAQNGGVLVLGLAGGLKGKNFAISDYFITGDGKQYFNPSVGTYRGDGVIQDGNIITSGICPFFSKFAKKPDGTAELTQKLVALMQQQGADYGQSYVPTKNEECYGTWINDKTINQGHIQKKVCGPDGNKDYSEISDPTPVFEDEQQIDSKWTDAEGNIWYKTYGTVKAGAYKGTKWQELDKLSKSATVWEYVFCIVADFSPNNYPSEVSPTNGNYRIFYRAEK